MADQAPDRVDGLFFTMFTKGDKAADPQDADRVEISLRSYTAGLRRSTFKLPREAQAFEDTKRALIAAFELGQEAARRDIRDALGIKECNCNAD